MPTGHATDSSSTPRPPLRAAERRSAEDILKQAYHLEPHTFKDDAAFKAYDAEIMAVCETAKERTTDFLAALHKMLPGKDMIPYFYYDGALLLLALQDTPSNAKLAASCLVKGDPRDVRGEPHLRTLIEFGRRGLDVTVRLWRSLTTTMRSIWSTTSSIWARTTALFMQSRSFLWTACLRR